MTNLTREEKQRIFKEIAGDRPLLTVRRSGPRSREEAEDPTIAFNVRTPTDFFKAAETLRTRFRETLGKIKK